MSEQRKREERTWSETIEVAAGDLVGRIKELIAAGNVRRLIIRSQRGDVLIQVPLTAGVVVGGILALVNPMLAAIGVVGGALAKVRVEVVRVADERHNDD
jgi:hypothetical protein